jgi:hypothetical protein
LEQEDLARLPEYFPSLEILVLNPRQPFNLDTNSFKFESLRIPDVSVVDGMKSDVIASIVSLVALKLCPRLSIIKQGGSVSRMQVACDVWSEKLRYVVGFNPCDHFSITSVESSIQWNAQGYAFSRRTVEMYTVHCRRKTYTERQ